MATSSTDNSSTVSCDAHFAESFSRMLPGCNVRIANLLVMLNASPRLLRNASVNQMQKQIRTKIRSITGYLTDSNHSLISAPTGVVIADIFSLLVRETVGNVQVKSTQARVDSILMDVRMRSYGPRVMSTSRP